MQTKSNRTFHKYNFEKIYCLIGDCKPYPHNVNFRNFFSETNKHRTMKLYIATFPLSMHKLCFFL